MSLAEAPKGHRFPMSIISHAVWRYHRFNDSYRDRFCRICVLQIKRFLFWQIFIHTKPSAQRSFRKLIDLVFVR